ncbi:MAG TPA: winged helix-turn-helix domain-containing protein, partial [Chloroflexota bacterium]
AGKEDDDQVIRTHEVVIDLGRRLVTRADTEIHLTPTEFAILRFLAQHLGRVVTHDVLLRSVMGPGYENSRGELRVYIAALRKKLEADPARPRLLLSEMGVGYRLRAD